MTPQPMGHEYVGVVTEIGAEVKNVKVGDFVVGSFVASDNTCEICQAGYQSRCVHSVMMGAIGTQSEYARIPLADGTLVATPGQPDADLIPSLLAASDVLGTGWFAAVAAEAGPGKTVAVVGDGAVGLLGILAARELGAERIIAMSRHADRQALAREFGATDIVEERGDAGVAKIKELTGGLGAHSVIEAVGTQESMDAGDPRHPPRRTRRLRRRLPRRLARRARAVLLRRAPARRTRPGPPVPARADPADLGPQDRPRQGRSTSPCRSRTPPTATRRWTSAAPPRCSSPSDAEPGGRRPHSGRPLTTGVVVNIEPAAPTVKNPPEQFAGEPTTTTVWKEHITDDDYRGHHAAEEAQS